MKRLWRVVSVIGMAAISSGCGGSDAPVTGSSSRLLELTEPTRALPNQLSETGLFSDARSLTLAEPALVYEPGFPLWSDGGDKQRALVLPDAASIDASGADYGFPVGTLLFKTFSFRTPASPEQPLPVETRVLRLRDDGWELAAYAWDDAGTDARLLDLQRSQRRDVLSDSGDVVEHAIPSRLECRQCHESSTSEVLGVTELQLARSGSLERLASRIEPAPRAPFTSLPEHGPLGSAVLGYFVGNCVHCHNGSNGAASSFDLRPDVAFANTIEQPTASSATAAGLRVAPGKPAESVLYLGVAGGDEPGAREVKDMPPLGVALRDGDAVRLLGDWITALGSASDP